MRRFLPFFKEVFSYSYSDEPYYSKLRHQLTKILLDTGKLPVESIQLKQEGVVIIKRANAPRQTG